MAALLAGSGTRLPGAMGTTPVATELSHGRATSTSTAHVSADLVADRAGVQILSDHSSKLSCLGFPLSCSSCWGGLAASPALGRQGCCACQAAGAGPGSLGGKQGLSVLWEQSWTWCRRGAAHWPAGLGFTLSLPPGWALLHCSRRKRVVVGALELLGLSCSESSFQAAA